MSINKKCGKILALLREIKLKETTDTISYYSGFPSNLENNHTFGNVGVEFWYTSKSEKICKDLAKMIIMTDTKYKDCDNNTVSEEIKKIIQCNVLNKELFNTDMVFRRLAENLFEATNNHQYNIVAQKIYNILKDKLLSIISDWMILYPLHQLCFGTFCFKSLNIESMDSNKLEYWNNVNVDYRSSHCFNPVHGKYFNTPLIPSKYENPPNWLIYKTNGSIDGSIKKMEAIIRELFACAYAFIVNNPNDLINLTDKTFPSYCIVFPKESDKVDHGVRINPTENLQPSFAVTARIDSDTLCKIEDYLSSLAKMSDPYRKRFKDATQSIHYGIMSNSDTERFKNFYIALDALFGEKGNVKGSIIDGIIMTNHNESKIKERSMKLYDLRNEILHGGISRLDEWKGYNKYIETYDIDPYIDIEVICYRSIKKYYNYVISKANSSNGKSKVLNNVSDI